MEPAIGLHTGALAPHKLAGLGCRCEKQGLWNRITHVTPKPVLCYWQNYQETTLLLTPFFLSLFF